MSNEKKVINDNIFFTKTVSICKNLKVKYLSIKLYFIYKQLQIKYL